MGVETRAGRQLQLQAKASQPLLPTTENPESPLSELSDSPDDETNTNAPSSSAQDSSEIENQSPAIAAALDSSVGRIESVSVDHDSSSMIGNGPGDGVVSRNLAVEHASYRDYSDGRKGKYAGYYHVAFRTLSLHFCTFFRLRYK